MAEGVRGGAERSRARRFLARRSAPLRAPGRCETITEGRNELFFHSGYPLQSLNSQMGASGNLVGEVAKSRPPQCTAEASQHCGVDVQFPSFLPLWRGFAAARSGQGRAG